jgi:hypothetical protein
MALPTFDQYGVFGISSLLFAALKVRLYPSLAFRFLMTSSTYGRCGCFALLVGRSPSSANRSARVHAENVGIGGKKVDGVVIGALGACNRLVSFQPGSKALSSPILSFDAVLVDQRKRPADNQDNIRSGVGVPTC